ncbi:MAG: lipopolysaccharide heptosyltransferase II [Pirellulales bacterium]
MATNPSTDVRTLCVFLPNWIGDVVMATPTLRALRQRYPAPTRIIGVMRPYVAKVLAGVPWLDDHLYYDRHSRKPELSTNALIRHLRAQRPDMAVLLSSSFQAAWAAWRSGARRRIGHARNLRGLLLTDRGRAARQGGAARGESPGLSTVEQYLQLAELAGCTQWERRVELATLPTDEAAVDLAWTNLGLHGRRVVLLNINSAAADARLWPREHTQELARRLVAQTDVSVLLLCGPAEKEATEQLEREISHPRVHSMARQDLGLSVSRAVLKRGDLLVTTDSGPRHIAAAFATPTIVLFGPTSPQWTINYSPVEQGVSLGLSCQPCDRKTCPLLHHQCMRDLTPERVLQAVLERLPSRAALAGGA